MNSKMMVTLLSTALLTPAAAHAQQVPAVNEGESNAAGFSSETTDLQRGQAFGFLPASPRYSQTGQCHFAATWAW